MRPDTQSQKDVYFKRKEETIHTHTQNSVVLAVFRVQAGVENKCAVFSIHIMLHVVHVHVVAHTFYFFASDLMIFSLFSGLLCAISTFRISSSLSFFGLLYICTENKQRIEIIFCAYFFYSILTHKQKIGNIPALCEQQTKMYAFV